jgi:hypothetical protein
MIPHNMQTGVVAVIKLAAAAGIAYVVYLGFSSLFPRDSWPPKDEGEEKELIAGYKQKLRMGDSPLSPRTPEDTARYLSRIIDYEVQKGERKTGREYVTQAIGQKMDDRVETLVSRSESKDLIAKMRNALRKRDDLVRLIALYQRRPADTASQDVKDKFDREFKELSAQYCATPFDASACPELAAEIGKRFRADLEAAKRDPRLEEVVEETKKVVCLTKPE